MTDKIVEYAYKGHTLEYVSQTFRLPEEEVLRIWNEWRSNTPFSLEEKVGK